MTEALEGTVAPFVNPVKPQVFPWPAQSLARDRHDRHCDVPHGARNQSKWNQPGGAVVPCFIGFLARYGASDPAGKAASSPPVHKATMLLIFAAGLPRRFRFAFNRHNFATDVLPAAGPIDHRSTVGAMKCRESAGDIPRESQAICLPKSWADAGAFSLLTPRSKLAQY